MSSKRYSATKNFARAKKPKLDISVIRNSPQNPANFRNSPQKSGETNIGSSAQTVEGLRKSDIDVDFWDDDDDDVILLATQRAEAAEAVRKTDENTITFTQFTPKVGTSTQTSSCNTIIETNHPIENDEAADFLIVPQTTKVSLDHTNLNGPGIGNSGQTTTETRRQLAQERQIKFLMDRLDLMKKDNMKLKNELSDSNDRSELKSGEVSLLRDELKHLRQQLQASKIEKLALADQKAIEETKQVTAKATELKLKNAEYRIFSLNQAKAANDFKNYYKQEGRSLPRHFLSMEKLKIQSKSGQKSLMDTDNCHIYKHNPAWNLGSTKKNLSNTVGALFKTDLQHLLLNYAHLEKEESTDEHGAILNSVCKVFAEFWSFAHSLDSVPIRKVHTYHSYPLTSRNQRLLYDLHQPEPLYHGERFVFLRRYVAILAMMCSRNRDFAKALLNLKHGELRLLQIASDSIQILGVSNDLPEHFGLLEAFSAFLASLIKVPLDVDLPEVIEPLFDMLKQLVFTRPSPWVFGQLSSCMLACSQNAAFSYLMGQMCVNSPKDCFVSDRVRSIYRFGPESCLLQVYAGLIELCFFSELPLEPSHFKLLLSTCRNHVDFVYQCFQNPPQFILKMLPSLGEADEDEIEATADYGGSLIVSSAIDGPTTDSAITSEQPEKDAATLEKGGCECYVKLCLSVVTLVFQLMHQWTLKDCKTDTEDVGKISQTAVHLLKLIFRENYLTCLFRDSEETTKHYLSLICSWWSEHAECLGFIRIHLKFLYQLKHCHFMLKPMIEEANEKNPELDFTEWNRTVDNVEDDTNLKEIDFYDYMIGISDFFIEIERLEEYVFE